MGLRGAKMDIKDHYCHANAVKKKTFRKAAHYRILSKIRTYFSKSQKSNSMLEFQAHICWVTTVDYKVRLGQEKSEFDWERQKLTRSVRASKLSIFSVKSHSVCDIIERRVRRKVML